MSTETKLNPLNPFEVELIEEVPESGKLRDALGIEEEREKELIDYMDKVYEKWAKTEQQSCSLLMTNLSKICQNANELSFITWQVAYGLGNWHGRQGGALLIQL